MSRSIPQWIKDRKYHFCAACGSEVDLQYHHLIPRVLGGKDEPDNIIVFCAECHQKWHGQGGEIKHNDLVREGIAKARERGIRVGRKPADGEKIIRMIAENSTQFNPDSLMTEHEIMDMAGIKPVCYNKYKRRLFDAMSADEWPYAWAKPVQALKRPLYDRVIRDRRGDYGL